MFASKGNSVANYKFRDQLNSIERCPPSDAVEIEKTAFRFVHSELADPRNFKPPAMINTRRHFPNEKVKCRAHALSMFECRDKATLFFKNLEKSVPNVRKSIGTLIAKGNISRSDGRATRSEKNGHFDLFLYESESLSSKFTIDSEIQ